MNTPEEYGAAMTALAQARRKSEIRVQYYALLREQAGRSEETLDTAARTPRELYDELQPRYPFTLAAGDAARGGEHRVRRLDAAAADGDAVVFIPPVAGG